MTNPANKAYEAVSSRMANAAAAIAGVVWVPVQLVQPPPGMVSIGYRITLGLAAAATIFGVATALDARAIGGFWRTLGFAFGAWKEEYEREQRIDSHETPRERSKRNRGTLQLSLLTFFCFLFTVVAAIATSLKSR